jgi:hypothetical protein
LLLSEGVSPSSADSTLIIAIVVPLAIVGLILIAILLAARQKKKQKKNVGTDAGQTSAARQDNFESARRDPDDQYGTLPRSFGESSSSYVSLKAMSPSVHSDDYLTIPSTASSDQLGRGYDRVPNVPQGAMYNGAPHVSQIARIEVSDFT